MPYIAATLILLTLKYIGFITWSILVCLVPVIIWIGMILLMWMSTAAICFGLVLASLVRRKKGWKKDG